jgi:hypothetical protein
VSCCDETDLYYDPVVLQDVWASMIYNATGSSSSGGGGGGGGGGGADVASTIATKPTFLHDVADIGTQVTGCDRVAASRLVGLFAVFWTHAGFVFCDGNGVVGGVALPV